MIQQTGRKSWTNNYEDNKAKCRHLKKWDSAAGVSLSKAPQDSTPTPLPATHCLYVQYIRYFDTEKGGGES